MSRPALRCRTTAASIAAAPAVPSGASTSPKWPRRPGDRGEPPPQRLTRRERDHPVRDGGDGERMGDRVVRLAVRRAARGLVAQVRPVPAVRDPECVEHGDAVRLDLGQEREHERGDGRTGTVSEHDGRPGALAYQQVGVVPRELGDVIGRREISPYLKNDLLGPYAEEDGAVGRMESEHVRDDREQIPETPQ
ncbi:MAG: hypothetical protein AUG44_24260 [Actinobacteria bacterium 13_1_20CM_3_71_11]|nr:MAG: hypothetical protein AUG44_24260 [Actinobacteria bacterium 13_1_20CM_3_71_11]